MTIALRNTGIEPVGEMPWGTHFCHFYETRDDLLETLLPFFKAGLEAGEFCAWIVSEPLEVPAPHQFAVAGRGGGGEVVETPQLTQAKAEIARLNRDLEQRVLERTTELEAVIGDQKRASEALQEAQMTLAHVTRLTTISELTASLAHEVNQPLAAIEANAAASLNWLDHTPPALDEARQGMQLAIRDAQP